MNAAQAQVASDRFEYLDESPDDSVVMDGRPFGRQSFGRLPFARQPFARRPVRTMSRVGTASRLGSRREPVVRAIDFTVALVALALFAPLMLLIALAIRILDPGPVFFAHRRMGRNGGTFRCLKFRTMVVDAEARLQEYLAADPEAMREWQLDHKLRRDPRITPLGNFLRRSSLDELPQLFNVLMGQMSLVGPRPIVAAEAQRYGRYFAHYCDVRPGMTGLWQVSGRNDVSYRRRVAMDVAYCRTKSVTLYLWIIVRTVPAVLAPKGSY
jgi:exopolysaccharide production protein ExoY